MTADVVPVTADADLPSHYLLRVTRRAWTDLGVAAAKRTNLAFVRQRPLLRKFWETFASPDAVDNGELLREVLTPKVFRIRAGEWRGAVWYDKNSGVVWLLRALSLARFHEEADLYSEFRAFEDRKQLLPSSEELILACSEQYVHSLADAIREASDAALSHPGTWHYAVIVRPNGARVAVGRVYVARDDVLVTQYVVVLGESLHPRDIVLPSGWRAVLLAIAFDRDEPVRHAYDDLPSGADRRPSEIALAQERLLQDN